MEACVGIEIHATSVEGILESIRCCCFIVCSFVFFASARLMPLLIYSLLSLKLFLSSWQENVFRVVMMQV